MADADQLSIAYVEETDWGVLEPANPTLAEMRITSESLQQLTAIQPSAEIRDDRQLADIVRTSINAGGDINWELSFATFFDDLFRHALLSGAWSDEVQNTGTFGTHATLNKFTGTGIHTGMVVNQWIKTSGFDTAANNGYFKITATTTDEITVAQTLATGDTGDADEVVTMGAQIVNGTTLNSISIEKHFTDTAATEMEHLAGMAPNTMNFNVPVDGIITGSFGMMGKNAVSAEATFGDGSNTAADVNEVMASVDDVSVIYENAASHATTGFTLALNNNLRSRLQIATLGPTSLGTGICQVTGTLLAYFIDEVTMDKYLNFTTSALATVFEDSTGKSYLIDLPNIKYTDGKRVAGGQNQDIIADMSWSAFRHAVEDVTMRMAKWAS